MAFVAIASALPLVSEASAAIGIAAAEITGIEAAGGIAAGVVLSQAGGAIESGISSGVDYIFGSGAYDNTLNSAKQVFEDSKELFNKFSNSLSFDQSTNQQALNLKEASDLLKKYNIGPREVNHQISQYTTDLTEELLKNGIDLSDPQLLDNNSNVANIIRIIGALNPINYYISSKLLSKISELVIPNDPDFQLIYNKYNGKGLYNQNTNVNDRGFTLVDENGDAMTWRYDWNNHRVIPPIWGVFCGLNSPNNKGPIRGKVTVNGTEEIRDSYLDKISMLHDIDYHFMPFSKWADYKLISRADQGKNLFIFPNELETANVAISYFSTLGQIARNIYGDPKSEEMFSKLRPVQAPNEQAPNEQAPNTQESTEQSIPNEQPVSEQPVPDQEMSIFEDLMTQTVEVSPTLLSSLKSEALELIVAETEHSLEKVLNGNYKIRSLIDNLEIQLN